MWKPWWYMTWCHLTRLTNVWCSCVQWGQMLWLEAHPGWRHYLWCKAEKRLLLMTDLLWVHTLTIHSFCSSWRSQGCQRSIQTDLSMQGLHLWWDNQLISVNPCSSEMKLSKNQVFSHCKDFSLLQNNSCNWFSQRRNGVKAMVTHDMVSSDQIDKCSMLLCPMKANVVVGGPL